MSLKVMVNPPLNWCHGLLITTHLVIHSPYKGKAKAMPKCYLPTAFPEPLRTCHLWRAKLKVLSVLSGVTCQWCGGKAPRSTGRMITFPLDRAAGALYKTPSVSIG